MASQFAFRPFHTAASTGLDAPYFMASTAPPLPLDRPWLGVLVVAPVQAFVAFILAFSVNVPVGDDFVVLDEVVALREAPTVSQFVSDLFASHQEHRLVLTRSLTYALSLLPGGIDFRSLELLAVAALLGALVTIGKLLGLGHRWGLRAILLLVILQPQQHKLMFYSMAATQAYFGLFFAMTYLYLVMHGGRTASALACLVGAALTSGAWIVLPPLGGLILLARRDWTKFTWHITAGAVLAVAYFHGELGPREGAMAYALQHPFEAIRLFLGIGGAVAELPTYRYSSSSEYTILAAGAALAVLAALSAVRTWRTGRRAAGSVDGGTSFVLIYCATMIGLIVANRIDLYHADWVATALDGKYRLYGLLALAVCLVEFVRRSDSDTVFYRRVWIGTLAATLALNVGWYAYRAAADERNARDRAQGLHHWHQTGDPSGLTTWANSPEMAGEVLSRATSSSIFHAD